jgi:hypothetical protein
MVVCLLFLVSCIFAGCGSKAASGGATTTTAKKTLVTVTNGSEKLALTEDEFSSMKTKQKVTDPNLKATHDYEGVKLSDLMAKVNAKDCKTVKVIAKDKMTIEIKAEDATKYPIMIANVQDGKGVPGGEGGPVKLIYPYDEYPDIKDLYKPDTWCWFVVDVEFVK